ncbi:homoserine dehydrogenase family protein [Nonlabens ponticola]|uniref:Homoserine dehydrogenase n=1 Tax=Nonlabens ponticola TaxID=2496866 RepID=A0A3S9MWQ6_9FLAO|nr:aspartate kinase [Nonlabens ponticola]AZQ43549.1 aspartate kinase [Nonlabens ponticola]
MKEIHLYIFGIGNVGSKLIEQVLQSHSFFKIRHHLDVRIVGLANSRKVLIEPDGIDDNWKHSFENDGVVRQPDSFYQHARYVDAVRIAVDATASKELSHFYPEIASEGFHIVTANKIANTLDQQFYDHLRSVLKNNQVQFLYETNVGAGLPIVQTVQQLTAAGEQLHAINGVFSGSLGYIFNRFSQEDVAFSQIVKDALVNGYTEPDPREDLSGNDVARKLLVLAREAGRKLEFKDIEIENLVPADLQELDTNDFIERLTELDADLEKRKQNLEPNHVLRHLGTFNATNNKLKVSLQAVPEDSAAGQLRGSDGFFEIYSESYSEHPLVIKGAGAGREVTARGLLSDIITIARSSVAKQIFVEV